MKKILFILLVVFITIIIYTLYINKKIIYFSICSNKYTTNIEHVVDKHYNYYYEDIRITDVINDLNNNTIIKDRNFKNILVKSNIILLDSTLFNINKNLTIEYIDQYTKKLEEMIILIKKYSKEKIYIIGMSNKKNSQYFNNKIRSIANNYNLNYIDISNYNYIDKDFYNNVSIKIKEKTLKTVDF